MWAQACNLIDQADRMHRQYFRLTVPQRTQVVWEPPVDLFEDMHEVVIVVALPGVPDDRIEVVLDGADLVIRAECRLPFYGSSLAIHRLEIPYGQFERRIRLPETGLDGTTRESANGCLILRLRKTSRLGER